MHHDNYFLGAEQPLRHAQRPQRVVGDEPTCIADDVRVAALQAEHHEQIHPRVHTRQHRHLPTRARAKRRGRKLFSSGGRVGEHLVCTSHRDGDSRSAWLALRQLRFNAAAMLDEGGSCSAIRG